jgi:glutamate-ammonia-ligase adenylyltransferase
MEAKAKPTSSHAKENTANVLKKVFELTIASGADLEPTQFITALENITSQMPDQFMSLNNLERFLAVTPNSTSILSDLFKDRKLLHDFLTIISTSQYLADILVKHPSYFRFLFSPAGIESQVDPVSLEQELLKQIPVYRDASHKDDYIRRIYKREILRIGARDICGRDTLESTTSQISALAETILRVYFKVTTDEFHAKYGIYPPPISCIALGKLGGNELNYSSDIDLLFLFVDYHDTVDLSNPDLADSSALANRFVTQLVQHLTSKTSEGHLYRVDLRLRPDGSSGPAAQSLESVMAYYESRGELWERQMLIKARHVAGDQSISQTFMTDIKPFVYPRTWLENPLDEIPRMKVRIENTQRSEFASNPSEMNIKLRRGGIRDIEFIVQALQLLNGGSHPEIQTGNTLQAIKSLEKNGLIDKREASLLEEAYKFYRVVEHRLQLLRNLQTHSLPTDAVEFRSLSKRCGFKNERKFRNELFAYFDAVAALFNNVFRIEQPIERTEMEQLLEGSINDERTKHVLENLGFTRIEESYRNVQYLSRGITRAGDIEFPTVITKTFREIAPGLFEDIKLSADQDLTLKNLARLVRAVKSTEVFYKSLMDENFRKLILTLCSKATRFVDYLTAEPLLLDMTLTSERLFDSEIYSSDFLPVSLQKKFNEIKIGMLYLLEEISLSEMHSRWTKVAEHFFIRAVNKTFPKDCPILVAGGKFGSSEMAFTSDLDVVMILQDRRKQTHPVVEKKIPEIQEHLLDENGSPIFTIDFKLRPEGKSAPLLMTETEYKTYLKKRLSIWEIMAMTRFRRIIPLGKMNSRNTTSASETSDGSEKVESWIRDVLAGFKLSKSSIEEIGGIYNKVIQSKKYFDEIDVKTTDGGMFAVELLTQTLALKKADELAETFPSKITEMIDNLEELSVLDDETASEIKEAYEFYRAIEFSNYVSLSKTTHKIPHDENELNSLALHLDFKNPVEFLDSLKSRMRRMSSLFRRTMDELTKQAS